MHLRGNIGYHTWEEFWEKGYRSPYFKAEYDETSEKTDWSLSERQLFTQSNGRTLIGQDTMGRLHFACTPHERIYAVPSGGPDVGGQFKGHIGQYYQNDTALFLGKMKYELEMDNGLLLNMTNQKSETQYVDYFLPVTFTEHSGLETKVFSFAPVLEKEAQAISSIHPLPGPAGVFFCAEVKNTSGCTLKGKLRLSFDRKFVNQFEHYGKRFEDYAVNPYRTQWEQKLLVMWHPEACAAIQLLEAVTEGEASNPFIYVPFELKEGESRLFATILALTPERKDIHANLGILYQHTPLEWLNVTSSFWKERLGSMRTEIREDKEAGEKYADMHIRFVLDNFNCLSFDEYGNLLTNWQGAPSHSLSRLWGIDIEPDVVSVMYAVPEAGPKAMEYLAKRNVPRYSLYTDHSMFFYIAFLVIAGKYLEMTGDADYFRNHREISDKAEEIYQGMLEHKHQEKALFSSRYASDLIVFKKYDYGANVQCFYALKAFRQIRKAQEGEYVPADYMPTSEKNTDGMYQELVKYIGKISNSYLRQAVEYYFVKDEAFIEKFKLHSAAKSVHHGFSGGLLEHTLSVVKFCEYMIGAYPILNADLLYAAAICHDMGKTKELSPFPDNDYTDDGQLLGHIVIGVEMVSEAAGSIPEFPGKLASELKHCIVAHHGELEYGSPKKPALAEAFALHFADSADAKMQSLAEIFKEKNSNDWLGYNRLFETNLRKTII